MSFKNLNLINSIIRAATEAGRSKPTGIQEIAIPCVLEGKDIIGCVETGPEKNATFIMPILQLLKRHTPDHKEIRILILTPTRDLAMQIEQDLGVYSKYLPLSQFSIYDGISIGSQLAALGKRVDILVATPGKLVDLINQRHIDLSKIEILVLDEVDRMFDLGFVNDIKKVIKLTSQKKQVLFFSATMPMSIRKFAETILKNPVKITTPSISSTLQTGKQAEHVVEKENNHDLLSDIKQKKDILRSLVFASNKVKYT